MASTTIMSTIKLNNFRYNDMVEKIAFQEKKKKKKNIYIYIYTD